MKMPRDIRGGSPGNEHARTPDAGRRIPEIS